MIRITVRISISLFFCDVQERRGMDSCSRWRCDRDGGENSGSYKEIDTGNERERDLEIEKNKYVK